MVKIVTDSTSDVPLDAARELDIGMVPVIVEIDGTSYLDGVTLSRQQFYRHLDAYREIPRTAAPSVDVFKSAYRAAKATGASEVISIHLNRRFSVLPEVAGMAAHEVADEGIHVSIVDSESVTMGLGSLVIRAAQMAQHGSPTDEVVRQIEMLRPHVRIYAVVDTLRYLRRSGRANAMLAGLGDMLQLKILLCVRNGLVEQIDRVRTRARGLSRLVELAHMHRHVQHLSVLYTTMGQGHDITMLQENCTDLVPHNKQYDIQVTPVLGAHVGPMAIGLAMLADV